MTKKEKDVAVEVETSEGGELVSVDTIETETLPSVAGANDMDNFLQDEADNDDSVDYIPRVRLMQKGDFDGKFYSEELAMEFEEMTLSLLKITDSRVLWPEKYNSENQPLCRSHDGVTPACDIKKDPEDDDSELLAGMAEKCDGCSYAKWGKGKTPPRCTGVKDLLVLDLDSNIPFFLSFASTTLTPLKAQLTKPLVFRKMALTSERSKAGLPPAHSCMFKFNVIVDPEKRITSSGESYLPKFSNIEVLDGDTQDFAVNVAFQLRNFTVSNVKEEDKQQSHSEPSEKEVGDDEVAF